jgi:hypothetical protein
MMSPGPAVKSRAGGMLVAVVAVVLAASSVAAQSDIAAKKASNPRSSIPVGPTITIDNGVSGDGRFEVVAGRGGESSTVNIDPPGAPPLQDIMFELNHYVDVGADGGAVELNVTTITQEPTLVDTNVVISKGTFAGKNGAVNWTAVSGVAPGGSTYGTALTFSSNTPLGTLRIIQYADIDVSPLGSNDLVALGAFNQPTFQLLTIQNPANGNVGLRMLQPQVSNASCGGWAARPYPDLITAIVGNGTTYSPTGAVVDLSSVVDARFPGAPAYGPDDITAAIACDVNPDATQATVVFTISAEANLTAPDTTIISGPTGTIATDSASFSWTGIDAITPTADLVYAFRLDPLEPAFSAFTSATSKTYTGLANGTYTFLVKARNQASTEDPTPASQSFTVNVDSTPPDTTITSGPSGTVGTSSASFAWTGTDDVTPEASLVYAFRLDPVEATFSDFGTATSKTYTGLANGTYTFLVKARDEAGNEDPTPASQSFTVSLDRTPPDTTITGGPSGTVGTSSASFSWTGTDNVTPTGSLVYAFRLDPLETTFSAFGATISKTYSGLADGSYTFLVKARDEAGNEDPTPASRSFTVNVTAATVSTVTGNVVMKFQGTTLTPGAGSLLLTGTTLETGAGGQVQGSCADGSHFTLGGNSQLFLADSLCQPTGPGLVDLTQGQFMFTVAPRAAQPNGRAGESPFGRGVDTPVSRSSVGADGADFSTTYGQFGRSGTATTTVTNGTVTVTDVTTGVVTILTAGQQTTVTADVPGMVASVLPGSRSVQVGTPATAFATMINAGAIPAIVCQPSLVTSVPATLDFQTTDPNTNEVTGAPDTPISIPPQGSQSFVFALTPTAPIPPTDIALSFACGGTAAPTIPGVSTLLLSASPTGTPVPDIVALAASATPGIVKLPGPGATGVFVVATVNVGASGMITVSADTGSVSSPVAVSLCQTDPQTSACLAPAASSVTTTVDAGATPTFGIFVTGNGATIPLDPASNRIFVRFKDAADVIRGATSVAVTTE